MNIIDVTAIAKICHQANKAYCETIGDDSQPEWDEAPEWQQQSAIAGVKAIIAKPESTPRDAHRSWMAVKKSEGWKYGEKKDAKKKTHPCFMPYEELPEEMKLKDFIFSGIVKSIIGAAKND